MANLFLARAESRRHEAAIRRAIGAQRHNLIRCQLIETTLVAILAGVRVVALGLAVGMIGVLAGARTLTGLLYGVQALDTTTLAVTSLLMLAIGAAASWVPAWRASAVDPVKTLAEA